MSKDRERTWIKRGQKSGGGNETPKKRFWHHKNKSVDIEEEKRKKKEKQRPSQEDVHHTHINCRTVHDIKIKEELKPEILKTYQLKQDRYPDNATERKKSDLSEREWKRSWKIKNRTVTNILLTSETEEYLCQKKGEISVIGFIQPTRVDFFWQNNQCHKIQCSLCVNSNTQQRRIRR